jgi:hypothetical protein
VNSRVALSATTSPAKATATMIAAARDPILLTPG